MNCVIDDYLKYINNFLVNYYKMILGSKYDKKIIMPFIDKYIDVRYFNNSIYESGTCLDKINKELKLVAKELVKEDKEKEDIIKLIFTLFGYILYFDDCEKHYILNNLLKTFYEDKNITIFNPLFNQDEFKSFIKDFREQKDKFFKLFDTNKFNLIKKRLAKKTYKIDIEQHCNISPLYSQFAINKAFNAEVVVENKVLLLYFLLSSQILKEVIDMEFNNNYIVDFPVTLFSKDTKINRYLNTLDNDLVKQKVHLHFNYMDYLKYKDKINSFIKEGFNICVTLDNSFIDDYNSLILFSYVFIYEKYDYYDNIIEDKDNINANIVTL